MDYFINVLQTKGEDFFYSSEDKEVSEVIDDFILIKSDVTFPIPMRLRQE